MITLISSKKLGGYKDMRNTVSGFLTSPVLVVSTHLLSFFRFPRWQLFFTQSQVLRVMAHQWTAQILATQVLDLGVNLDCWISLTKFLVMSTELTFPRRKEGSLLFSCHCGSAVQKSSKAFEATRFKNKVNSGASVGQVWFNSFKILEFLNSHINFFIHHF